MYLLFSANYFAYRSFDLERELSRLKVDLAIDCKRDYITKNMKNA